jgi:hypothetical protein
MSLRRELFEGTKDAGIAVAIVVALLGMSAGIALILHSL